MFDVAGLVNKDAEMALGSPLFDKVTITLNKDYYPGKEFVIETTNNSHENKYAQQYELNGEVLTEPAIPFEAIIKGGKLSVTMGNTPKDK
jgi:putative alpha-1,2-mannosidase